MCVGFIKLHRKITEWEWYSDINATRLFIHLLITANFEDKKWKGISIKRGQIVTSLANLSKETSLSVRSIRTALNKLKSTNELTSKTTSKFTILTLVNYGLYQDKEKIATSKTTSKTTNERQTNDKQTTTTKEGKEIKEGKEDNKYRPLSEGLFFILEEKLNKSLSKDKIRTWSEDIRKLVEIDFKNRPDPFNDVKRSIQSIADNYGNDYFPVIQSGKSLREKITKIENYANRNKSKSRLGWK